MPTVFIPAQLRELTGGITQAEVEGANVGQLVAALEGIYPGLAERLTIDGALATGLAVSVDGVITNRGLAAKVTPTSEVHFLPAFGGG